MAEKAVLSSKLYKSFIKYNNSKLNPMEKSVLQWVVFDKNEYILSIFSNNYKFIDELPRNEYVYASVNNRDNIREIQSKCSFANVSYSVNYDLNFENGFFNTVLSSKPISKINNLEHILREAKRVLKHGGQIILPSFYAPFGLNKVFNSFCKNEYGFKAQKYLSKNEIKNKLENAGFKNIDFHVEYGFILVCTAWSI